MRRIRALALAAFFGFGLWIVTAVAAAEAAGLDAVAESFDGPLLAYGPAVAEPAKPPPRTRYRPRDGYGAPNAYIPRGYRYYGGYRYGPPPWWRYQGSRRQPAYRRSYAWRYGSDTRFTARVIQPRWYVRQPWQAIPVERTWRY